jgi:hypothetical protein
LEKTLPNARKRPASEPRMHRALFGPTCGPRGRAPSASASGNAVRETARRTRSPASRRGRDRGARRPPEPGRGGACASK